MDGVKQASKMVKLGEFKIELIVEGKPANEYDNDDDTAPDTNDSITIYVEAVSGKEFHFAISSPVDLVTKGLAVDLFTSISTNSLFCYSFIQQPSLGRLSNFERWVLTLSKPVGRVDKQRKASKCEKMMHWPRSCSKHYHLMPNPSLTTEYLNLSLILVCHSNLCVQECLSVLPCNYFCFFWVRKLCSKLSLPPMHIRAYLCKLPRNFDAPDPSTP